MKSVFRSLGVWVGLVAVCLAGAQDSANWGGSRYVRVGSDRVLVLYKGATLDFQHDVSWDISDAGQKQQFESWVKKANLPKDPSQFVADLPPTKEVPLSAEIVVDRSSDIEAELQLKFGSDPTTSLNLHHGTGWNPNPSGEGVFAAFAKELHTAPSTLLVAFSGVSTPSEEQAWTRLVSRSQSPSGFVTLLGGAKEAVWSHAGSAPAGAPLRQKPAEGKPVPTATTDAKGAAAWVLPVGIGGLVILVAGVGFASPGVRSRLLGSGQKPAQTGAAAFPVGAHERELILKVREEGKRHALPANAPHSEEEYAVGMMLERYQAYGRLVQERDQAQSRADALQSYKQYQEKTEEFEKRYSSAKDAVAKLEAEVAKQQKAVGDLREKLAQAETYVKNLEQQRSELAKALAEADALLAETSTWSKSVSERLSGQAAKIHHE